VRLWLIFLLVVGAGAASLIWDANPVGDGVTNYRVSSGPASRSYVTAFDVGTNTSAVIPSNVPAFYVVTAQGAGGWSRDIGEVFFVPSPALSLVKLRIMARDGVTGRWNEFAVIPLCGTNGAEFFQLRITP
jgi:hypothetical protein